MQILQLGAEHGLGVAPDLHLAHPKLDDRVGRAGFADHVAVFAQTMRAQGLHDLAALRRAHLQHHAQLFGEQGFERELVAARADLARPVLAVADVGAAVGDAVAFRHEHVYIEGHADVAGKRHLHYCGKQAAIAAVVVGQDLALGAQGVDGLDQVHQILRMVQVRHLVAELAQRLRQHAATHAVLATAQVNQQQ